MTDPSYQPPPGPPPSQAGRPAPMPPPAASPPKSPLAVVQQIAKLLPILAYVTMGAALLSAIMMLTIDNVDGAVKFGEALSRVALGSGLGGAVLGLSALLNHRLWERGQS